VFKKAVADESNTDYRQSVRVTVSVEEAIISGNIVAYTVYARSDVQ
jgi:hypothetical protein